MDDARLASGERAVKIQRHMDLTCAPLQSDLGFASLEWQKDKGSQFWRRCVIRCLFAYVDCVLWSMKRAVPEMAGTAGVALDEDDLLLAAEQRIKNGEKVSFYFKFQENVKESIRLFGKAFGVPVNIQYDTGFDALCATHDVRSRLMHPKQLFDPAVSDDDMTAAKRGMDWFVREYGHVLEQCNAEIWERFGKASGASPNGSAP